MVGLEGSDCETLCGSVTEPQEVLSLVEDGRIDVRTVEYPLAEIDDVAAKLEGGDIEGRAVLKPSKRVPSRLYR